MSAMDAWRDEAAAELVVAFGRLDSVYYHSAFSRYLSTLGSLNHMPPRGAVVRLLDSGMHYAEISNRTGASTATITRIAQWLHHGEGGYTKALERMRTATKASPSGDKIR